MIEKMKFLNLTGPKSQIDRVAELYLSKYPIHLENALSQLHTVKNLRPITEENPYEEDLRRAKELMKFFPEEKPHFCQKSSIFMLKHMFYHSCVPAVFPSPTRYTGLFAFPPIYRGFGQSCGK